MPQQRVTVATFDQAANAHLSKAQIEEEGIEAFIADENTVTMNWLFSNAVGGIKLQVNAADAEKAIEILRGRSAQIEDDDDLRCPACGSRNVVYEAFSRKLFLLSFLLLGAPLPFLRRRWHCRGCGHEWTVR